MTDLEIVLAFLAWWGVGVPMAFLARHLMEMSLSLEYYGFEYEPITRKGAMLCALAGMGGPFVAIAVVIFGVHVGYLALTDSKWWREPLRGRK